jgi:RNA 2',3'-cyclic 3'-phosphodiesterase
MRSFLALDVSDAVIDYLSGVTERLAKMTPGVKWVKREGIHVTLKFFGEIEEAMAQKIHEALLPVGSQFSPFVVSLKQLDAFPSKRRARVVIVRLHKGFETMQAVYEEVEERLTQFDFEREKRAFTPHLTLGRMRDPAPFPNGDVPAIQGMEFKIEEMVLYKSTLTPAGALYAPIWKIKLGGDEHEGRRE